MEDDPGGAFDEGAGELADSVSELTDVSRERREMVW